jgi:hypothetical protein
MVENACPQGCRRLSHSWGCLRVLLTAAWLRVCLLTAWPSLGSGAQQLQALCRWLPHVHVARMVMRAACEGRRRLRWASKAAQGVCCRCPVGDGVVAS